MADYDGLELIVRYDNSKTEFEKDKSNYYGKVVFIAGSTSSTATIADKKQYIWVSGEGTTTGRYIDFDTIDRIKTIKVGTASIIAEGAATITLANGTGVKVTFSNNVISFALNDEYKNKIDDTASKATTNATDIANLKTTVGNINTTLGDVATKTELNNAVSGLISDGSDTSADNTIKGAKAYADSVAAEKAEAMKSELLGVSNDGADAETIRGNKNAIEQISDAFPVTISEAAGSGDIAKVYTVKQGLNTIGTINIPKELVVTSGSVVAGTWSGTSFTESTSGAGKAIKLTIANQTTPIYINVKDLVDVYTAQQNASQVQLSISASNVISATLVNGSVTTSILANGAVTTAKIADANVTTAKIAGGAVTTAKIADNAVTEDKIADSVLAKINSGNTSVQSVSGGDFISVSDTSGTTNNKSYKVSAKTKTMDAAKEDILLNGEDALATAHDVYNFIKARLSVKVIS